MVTRKDRPSKLLSLNASPKEQKVIATINATESPLLRLPPELRCRIYDHLFASITIHIRSVEFAFDDPNPRRHYKLSLCDTPHDHKHTPIRYVEHHFKRPRKATPGCTVDQTDDHPFTVLDIGLGLLSTCRQLYHEAVLKPFAQISFSAIAKLYHKHSGLKRFMDDLIPIQVKAIANLRITICNQQPEVMDREYPNIIIGPMPAKSTIARLRGLKNVEIVLAPDVADETDSDASLFISGLEQTFMRSCGMQSLVHARLRSLRVTMDARFRDFGARATPSFVDRGEKEMVEGWLREAEMRLHFGSVLSGDAPMPDFGTVQNDENVQIPHWATPEALEQFRLEEEREAEERRVAVLERRRLLFGENHRT